MPKAPVKKKKKISDSKPVSNKEAIQIERKAILIGVTKSSEEMEERLKKLIDNVDTAFAQILKTFRAHEDILHGILIKMENIDEMMSCILIAVRQNEYLQTYYPAQNGMPAGKYVGIHPSKLEGAKK